MPFISGGHLWLILILLVIVLIIWGPGKLPDVGSGLGRAIREFKRASSEPHEQVMGGPSESAARSEPAPAASLPAAPAPAAPAPAAPAPSQDGAREEQRVSG